MMDDDSTKFIRGLIDNDLLLLNTVPKAEKHCHMDLGGNFNYFAHMAGIPIERPPSGFNNFDQFQTYILKHLDPVFETSEGTKLAKLSTIKQCQIDSVVLLEASIDDGFSYHFQNDINELINFLKTTIDDIYPRLDFRPELGLGRRIDMKELETIAFYNIDTGYFASIDLYGDEINDDPRKYVGIFKYARKNGLKLKVHIGEFSTSDIIKRTIDLLEVDEIQHGNSAAKSSELMKFLADNKIVLNMCPTSNLKLGVVDRFADHPIRVLFDHGVKVTINTDDQLIFGNSLSSEFQALFNCGLFSAEELNQIRLNALD